MNPRKIITSTCASLALAPLLANAAIYKCTLPDSSVVFQQECPAGSKAEKQKISEVSNLGFNGEDAEALRIGDELLKNGEFEQETSHWQVFGPASTASKEGTAGTTALRLASSGPEPSRSRIRQCLPAKGIGTMSASAFVKQEGAEEAETNALHIVWFTSDDCSGDGQYAEKLLPTAAPGWQRLTTSGLAPMLGAQSLMAEITHTNNANNDDLSYALWDDISLNVTALDDGLIVGGNPAHTRAIGENHIYNANFENKLDKWRNVWPTTWSEFGGESVSAGAHVKASSDFGDKIKGDALSQCFNVGTNTHFDTGISFKRDPLSSQTGSGTLRTTWFQNEDCQGRSFVGADVKASTSDGWQQLNAVIDAPSGAQSLLFRVEQQVDGAGYFGAFWDKAYVKAVK